MFFAQMVFERPEGVEGLQRVVALAALVLQHLVVCVLDLVVHEAYFKLALEEHIFKRLRV